MIRNRISAANMYLKLSSLISFSDIGAAIIAAKPGQ